MLLCPNMWQNLLLQNARCITNTIILCHIPRRSSSPDEVQGHFLLLNHKRLLQTRTKQIHHLPISQIIHHMLDNISIRHISQRPKNNHHRDIRPNIRQGTPNLITFNRSLPPLLIHLNIQSRSRPRRILHLRPRLDYPRELGRLLLLERIHVIVRHTLLSHDHLLRAVDDEIPPLIVNTLSQIRQLCIVLITQNAKQRTQHDGNISQKLLSRLFRAQSLSHILRRIGHIDIVPHPIFVHGHIHVKGSRIGQIPQTSLVREHVCDRPVLFDGGGFG
mmetsp:Transcript_23656/g.48975  ORF Transcript_23656/g.48975 Transcript_23656/m.48975 type:complete len:275 (+) Transcript_23656:2672-3496(+)